MEHDLSDLSEGYSSESTPGPTLDNDAARILDYAATMDSIQCNSMAMNRELLTPEQPRSSATLRQMRRAFNQMNQERQAARAALGPELLRRVENRNGDRED